jgi:hypothetical protein
MGPCWIVPGERMKSEKRHRVPLTDRTLEILRRCPREKDNPFVFIGENQGCEAQLMLSPSMSKGMASLEPTSTSVGNTLVSDDSAEAVRLLMAEKQHRLSPTKSAGWWFERLSQDPANKELAARAYRRLTASSVNTDYLEG